MAKTLETRSVNRKVKSPTEPEIRAAMAKAIREVKRAAKASKTSLAVAGKTAWSLPK